MKPLRLSHFHKFALGFGILIVLLTINASIPSASAKRRPRKPTACATPIATNWKITGNCGTTAGTHFVGTTDGQALVFKTNNAERMRIDPAGNFGIGTNAPSDKFMIKTATNNFGLTQTDGTATVGTYVGTSGIGIESGWFGTKTNHPLRFFAGFTGPVLSIETNGRVGIGTLAPSANVAIVKEGAPQPNVQGAATGLKVGTPAGTIPFAVKQNVGESATPTLGYFETGNGDLGYLGANTGTFVIGAAANKALAFNVNGSKRAMTIASNGVIGIGTTNITAKVHIRGSGTSWNTESFRVENANGVAGLHVDDVGQVHVNLIGGSSGGHVCHTAGTLGLCGSAAEYVPTLDQGLGFPQAADLVSIKQVPNPYNDEHGPFVVAKSTQACDANLLGFIVKPEFGADGKKLNDHYLPLAIFGYFPAKVTLENGAIKRGDPITSSSKPGYGMKATGACKVIGYALEDANAEGTIQVFAHLSENSAPEVAMLRAQVQNQAAQINEFKQQNDALNQRLAVLEQTTRPENGAASLLHPNLLLVGGIAAFGIVMLRRKRVE